MRIRCGTALHARRVVEQVSHRLVRVALWTIVVVAGGDEGVDLISRRKCNGHTLQCR